jgi:hypothetical protein
MRVELTYTTDTRSKFLVRSERLELSRIAPHAPQACSSTSFDMTAWWEKRDLNPQAIAGAGF